MHCPICAFADTKVLESRLSHEGRAIRRRRQCPKCKYRFTTFEKEEDFVFQVVKKDGRVEAFSREKALKSLQIATQKRPITMEQIELIVNQVEHKVQDLGERTIQSQVLGDMMMQGLRKLDKVAYVRFASVYKDFQDPDEFMAELKSLD